MRQLSLCLSILMVFLLAVSAADAVNWEERVEFLTQGAGRIDRIFEGPEKLTGIIIAPKPGFEHMGKTLAWGLPSGLLIFGDVIDLEGQNLSEVVFQEHEEWFVDPVSADLLSDIWEEAQMLVELGRAFSEGNGRQVFAFIDAFCPYCADAFQSVHGNHDYLKNNEIIWVPVAWDLETARTTGLLLEDNTAVMQTRSGTVNDPATAELVLQNRDLLIRAGKRGVPAYMMKNAADEIIVIHGNLAELLR